MRFLYVPPTSGTNLDLARTLLTHNHVIAGNKDCHGILLSASHARNIITLQTHPHFLSLPLLVIPDPLAKSNVIQLFQTKITLEVLREQFHCHLNNLLLVVIVFRERFVRWIFSKPFFASGGVDSEAAEELSDHLSCVVSSRARLADPIDGRKMDMWDFGDSSGRKLVIQYDCLRISRESATAVQIRRGIDETIFSEHYK